MSDINKVVIKGNLTGDPIIKNTTGGKTVCDFSIANNEFYNEENHASFFNCVAWGKTAEYIGKYFVKGHPVLIDGKLSWQSWTDQEGIKKSKVFITVEKINSLKAFSKTGEHDEQPSPEEHATGYDGFSDNDIPF